MSPMRFGWRIFDPLLGLLSTVRGLVFVVVYREARQAALLPALVTFGLLTGAWLLAFLAHDDLLRLIVDEPEHGAWRAAWLGAELVVFVALALLAVVFAIVMVGPLTGVAQAHVAHAVRKRVAGHAVPPQTNLADIVLDVARQIVPSSFALVAYVLSSAAAMFLILVPVVGAVLVVVVQTLLASWTLAWSSIGIPIAWRMNSGRRARLKFLFREVLATTGLGYGLLLMTFVPLLNLLLPVVSAAAGAFVVLGIEARRDARRAASIRAEV